MWGIIIRISLIFGICNLGCSSETNGLICYSCGTEAINDWHYPMSPEVVDAELDMETCESFQTAFSWGLFVVHCGEFEWCGKSITASGQIVVRGCVSRNDSSGQQHRLGCGTMASTRVDPLANSKIDATDTFCLCNSNFCNSTNCLSTTLFTMFIAITMVMRNIMYPL